MQLAGGVDEDRLAGRHVAHHPVAGALQRHGLAGQHHLGAAALRRGQVGHAVDQRADAVRVAKGQQAVAGDQRDHRVRAADALVHRADGAEHQLGCQRHIAPGQLHLVRQHVDQHLGIAAGVDMAAVHVEQLFFQCVGVGQVAVVHQHDAVRRVDVEGLGFFLVEGVAGGRVAHLAQAHIAGQRTHVAGAEHILHHAAGLVHEALRALHGDDAGSVLAAVLQQQQRVIDQLVDGRFGDQTNDAAHGGGS